MKVALVYDRVNKWGGAERVLLALHQIFPQAPLYTAVYDPVKAPWVKAFPQVIPSFLQKLPLAKSHHELYPWLAPLAFENFDFSGYDLVISVTSAEAKAIITRPGTRHICYCLTPTRYLWSHKDDYLAEPGLGQWLKPFQVRLQKNDLVYAQRPDEYVAISKTVQKRIKKYYGREAKIIYPPATLSLARRAGPPGNYFLIVSRLVAYKRIDLAIKSFNRMKRSLIIVGTGREEKRLKKIAGPTIKFAGWADENNLINYYQNCRALIMPQEEDFGISAVEAQAAGRPVIAYNRGGATETVVNNKTGLLFENQRVDSLTGAVKQFEGRTWNSEIIVAQAKKFAENNFLKSWQTLM